MWTSIHCKHFLRNTGSVEGQRQACGYSTHMQSHARKCYPVELCRSAMLLLRFCNRDFTVIPLKKPRLVYISQFSSFSFLNLLKSLATPVISSCILSNLWQIRSCELHLFSYVLVFRSKILFGFV